VDGRKHYPFNQNWHYLLSFRQPINALQGISKGPFGIKDKLTIHGRYAATRG